MSRSEDKFDVVVESMRFSDGTEKVWLRVVFRKGGQWVPSFEDLYRILAPIARLEDQKYPHLHQRGASMLIDFVKAAIAPHATWPMIQATLKIPDRDPSVTMVRGTDPSPPTKADSTDPTGHDYRQMVRADEIKW